MVINTPPGPTAEMPIPAANEISNRANACVVSSESKAVCMKSPCVSHSASPCRPHFQMQVPPYRSTSRAVGFRRQLAGLPIPHSEEPWRSEEHTSELQSLMRISYAVFCLKKKKNMQQ